MFSIPHVPNKYTGVEFFACEPSNVCKHGSIIVEGRPTGGTLSVALDNEGRGFSFLYVYYATYDGIEYPNLDMDVYTVSKRQWEAIHASDLWESMIAMVARNAPISEFEPYLTRRLRDEFGVTSPPLVLSDHD